jgi:hypothetical protein
MSMSAVKSLSLGLLVAIMSSTAISAQEATPAANASSPATAVASSPDHSLRGIRYCEILVPDLGGGHYGVALRVYTTQGLNDCPLPTWDAIDARTEARRLGVPMVFKNGPRFVAYDQISAEIDGAVESFEGLEMRLVAALELPAGSMPQDRPAYSGMVVARDTEYVYLAGKPVFELVAPDGSVYVMQTYVAPDDPNGDFSVLEGLAGRLTLPDGWTFREIVPDQDLHAETTNGQATVIRDDLGNTYQWLTGGDGTPVPAN